MKKTGRKRFVLRKDTLRALTGEDIYEARGGGWDYNKCTAGKSGCSTEWAVKCSHAL